MHIIAPIVAIMAIYAKENGKGMVFNPEDEEVDDTPPPEKTPPTKPTLRVVK
jgi:stringent starvation protein B